MAPGRRGPAGRAVVVAALLAGCGGGGSGGGNDESGACFEIARGMCTQYSGVGSVAEVRTACRESPLLGVWVTACPPDHRLAVCSQSGGAIETAWYPGAPACVSPPDASDCPGGTFTAGSSTCDGTPSVQAFACDHRSRDHRCTDISMNMEPNLRPALDDLCAGMGGTVSASACPASGRAATCSVAVSGGSVDERYYDSTSDSALCATRGGTWTAG